MGGQAERLLAAMIGWLPANRRELGRALLAELPVVAPGRARLGWIAGGLWFVVREGMMRIAGYALGLALAVGVLLWVDRSPSDDGGQFALLALLAGSAALGFVAPRRAWLAGLVIGAAIAVAHVVYLTLGPALPYKAEPAGLTGAATLLILTIPAVGAAYVGAGAAWLLGRALRALRGRAAS
jgi:hypothetical protein